LTLAYLLGGLGHLAALFSPLFDELISAVGIGLLRELVLLLGADHFAVLHPPVDIGGVLASEILSAIA
jgi:hypothetical protein